MRIERFFISFDLHAIIWNFQWDSFQAPKQNYLLGQELWSSKKKKSRSHTYETRAYNTSTIGQLRLFGPESKLNQ